MLKFSIVIPIYNGEEYVSKCLDSLINQSYVDWEAICVNDGSQDNSFEILKKYKDKDKRIKIYSQENKGVVIARNTALHYVTGDYILFVDVDDDLPAISLKSYECEILTSGFPDIVVAGSCVVRSNGKQVFRRPRFTQIDSVAYLKYIFSGKGGWELWAKAYKRELFNSTFISPDGIRVGEDAIFLVQLVCRAKHITGCSICAYNYRKNAGSVSHIRSVELAMETLRAAFFIEDFLKTETSCKNMQNYINSMCLLFYSNSTRRAILSRNIPLMDCLRGHFKFSSLKLLPICKAVYVLFSYFISSKYSCRINNLICIIY